MSSMALIYILFILIVGHDCSSSSSGRLCSSDLFWWNQLKCGSRRTELFQDIQCGRSQQFIVTARPDYCPQCVEILGIWKRLCSGTGMSKCNALPTSTSFTLIWMIFVLCKSSAVSLLQIHTWAIALHYGQPTQHPRWKTVTLKVALIHILNSSTRTDPGEIFA